LTTSCHKYKPPTTTPPVGDVKIVGKIKAGVISFEPSFSGTGDYFIVTPAFILYFNFLLWDTKEKALEIERLKKK
jgi:hypothetical protein